MFRNRRKGHVGGCFSTPDKEVLVKLGHNEENWKVHQSRHDHKRKLCRVIGNNDKANRLAAAQFKKPRRPKLSLRKRLEYAKGYAVWKHEGGSEEEFCAVYGLTKRDLRRYMKVALKDMKRQAEKVMSKRERERQLPYTLISLRQTVKVRGLVAWHMSLRR